MAMTESGDETAPGGSATQSSFLFLVRLWAEEDPGGATEWCGKVQHVTSGEAHTFRDWAALVALLRTMLPEAQPAGPDPEARRAARPAP